MSRVRASGAGLSSGELDAHGSDQRVFPAHRGGWEYSMTLPGTPLSVADALTDALARAQLVNGAFGLENRVRAVLAAALEGLARQTHNQEVRQ